MRCLRRIQIKRRTDRIADSGAIIHPRINIFVSSDSTMPPGRKTEMRTNRAYKPVNKERKNKASKSSLQRFRKVSDETVDFKYFIGQLPLVLYRQISMKLVEFDHIGIFPEPSHCFFKTLIKIILRLPAQSLVCGFVISQPNGRVPPAIRH